ncbi:ATP-NAD kinase family protein [Acidianus sp. RZ1]|uniref:ATP-NAD kinase family protein n=1 Tax=Acidianus sp. RZ1 TaxID=1540082 RepID=UPI001491758E|nr:ATP-NAD kinase family protein [Acidianus sp. RZ1]
MLKVGLIVNPYAGSGGRIGLKGSDNIRVENPEIPSRVERFLRSVGDFSFYVPKGKMGESYFLKINKKRVIIDAGGDNSSSDDTVKSSEILSEIVDIIVFVGGDGTARDVAKGLKRDIPILGIPGGVKMHSGVFASSPETAGFLISLFSLNEAKIKKAEILDVDEDEYRKGKYVTKLFAIATTIDYQGVTVPSKEEIRTEEEDLQGIAEEVIANIRDAYYIMGPGYTVKFIERKLGYSTSFLSTDLFNGKKLIKENVSYSDLLQITGELFVIVSPIGGQGFLFGRGNQEIGPEVLRRSGKNNIIVVASKQKIEKLNCLWIDTGDVEVDKMLRGVYKVIIGYNEYYAIQTCSMTLE